MCVVSLPALRPSLRPGLICVLPPSHLYSLLSFLLTSHLHHLLFSHLGSSSLPSVHICVSSLLRFPLLFVEHPFFLPSLHFFIELVDHRRSSQFLCFAMLALAACIWMQMFQGQMLAFLVGLKDGGMFLLTSSCLCPAEVGHFPDLDQRVAAHVHYTLLIACVLVAFSLGAILSGFLVSCYCSRSAAQHARKLGKDPEASLSHALSLRSLAKISGLLDTQSKVGVAEGLEHLHPPVNLSSFLFFSCRRTNWMFPHQSSTAPLSPTACRSPGCALTGSGVWCWLTASSIGHRYPDT